MTEISKFVEDLVARHGRLLISILEDVQNHYNYLPEEALRKIAKELNIPLRDVYGVATFYGAFRLNPCGKHRVHVCLGTACHVRGGKKVLEEMERELKIKARETTKDKEFTLETVNCLGACALGPIVVIDDEYHGNITPAKISSLFKKYRVSATKPVPSKLEGEEK
jgi:NADH:ubiquinone oxidoreductase subunit E